MPERTRQAIFAAAKWSDFVSVKQYRENVAAIRADGSIVLFFGTDFSTGRTIPYAIHVRRAARDRNFLRFGRSGGPFTLIDDAGGGYRVWNDSIHRMLIEGEQRIDLVDSCGKSSVGFGLQRNGDLVWSIGLLSQEREIIVPPPPFAARSRNKKLAGDWTHAVVKDDGTVVAWKHKDRITIDTKGKKITDLTINRDTIFGLTEDGEVRVLAGAQGRGEEVIERDVAWLRACEPSSLLLGKRDGSLALSSPNPTHEWVYNLMLRNLVSLSPDAFCFGELGLIWIEPVTGRGSMDLNSLAGWTSLGPSPWEERMDALTPGPSKAAHLFRAFPSTRFEMTGEFLATRFASGGIGWWVKVEDYPFLSPDLSYQIHFGGSGQRRVDGMSGSLLAGETIVRVRKSLTQDNTWARFRLRVDNDRFRGGSMARPYSTLLSIPIVTTIQVMYYL